MVEKPRGAAAAPRGSRVGCAYPAIRRVTSYLRAAEPEVNDWAGTFTPGGGHVPEIGAQTGISQQVLTAQTKPAGHVLPAPHCETEAQKKSREQNPPPLASVKQKQD